MLLQHGIQCLCDVRAVPRSRRHPQFEQAALARTLAAIGIDYEWWGDRLGGRRQPRADSPNHALIESGERGFADHMHSVTFRDTVAALIATGATRTLALMCAEADYQHCHRRFIADDLHLRGVAVTHIRDRDHAVAHALHPALGDVRDPPVYNRPAQGELFC